jgi:hypothetical protein
MDELTDEELARLGGWARVSFGAMTFVAPRWTAKIWTGEDITGTTAVIALRSLGARDLALGLGLLIALKRDAPVRGWLEAGALSDAGDAVSTLLSRRGLSAPRTLLGVVGSAGAAMFGRRLAEALGD